MNTFTISPRGSRIDSKELMRREFEIYRQSLVFNSKTNQVKFDLFLLDNLLKIHDCSQYITPMWKEHLHRITSLMRDQNKAILLDRMVRYAIYLSLAGEWSDRQIPYLESTRYATVLDRLLRESNALDHNIVSAKYFASESCINHLTHLLYFEEKTGYTISNMSSIVEFGGGYGGMTVLLKRLNPKLTITVIDVPEMIVLQQYYLSYEFGHESCNVLSDKNGLIKTGKVNYVPLTLLGSLNYSYTNLFVATWSLSEANKTTVDLIEEYNFFNAEHILYGYRYYETSNPKQPCSCPTPTMLSRDIKFHDSTFWCLDNEQRYLFI